MRRAAAKVTRVVGRACFANHARAAESQGYRGFTISLLLSPFFLAASSVKPVIAAKEPFPVDLIAEKRYAWCACGHSQKQPFCDGTHKKSAPAMSPLRFIAEESKKAWLCGCKYTKNPPYCDGTHKEDFVQKTDLRSQPQV
ncbi:CDGSH iron-sulfur domain-containing protein 3, mitochondrial isoform X3 [Notechis scutatus]|uniref:CDGSH iron-sulfur domain-containing protein 3, mitochondrial isoform X3 n=1 Tax=Notechis scutatus TaxID=8663 RepID=A0A6J1U4B0_9SAUR|nr:CDGSH iron-sulfur domain-containing protein 3, mitochondrial isoform X3 [Notechis scutatus]